MSSAVSDPTTAAVPPAPAMAPPGRFPGTFSPEAMEGMQAQISRLLGDMAGTMASIMCALGGRLGLFDALAGGGPVTSAELAVRAGLDERYVREWLLCLSSAGYIDVDRSGERFTLPQALALALAVPGSPFNMSAGYQLIGPLVAALPAVSDAFRTGGGVAQDDYDEALHVAMEGMSATWLDSMLVNQWLPAVPGLAPRLAEGARVADVGCGGGHALLVLARAFPNSRFVGYDAFGENVARARASVAAAGLSDAVSFVEGDAADAIEGPFDLVTAFDVLHDASDVAALLRSIRASLAPDGALLILEGKCAENPADNRGPAATVLYATSVLYCVPTSIAEGGAGLGTLGLPTGRLRDLCGQTGFRSLRPLPTIGPFNALYEVRP